VQITLLWRGGPASGFGGAGHGYAAAETVAFCLPFLPLVLGGHPRPAVTFFRMWASWRPSRAGSAACATRPYSRLGRPG
jgi:hypothetical protein